MERSDEVSAQRTRGLRLAGRAALLALPIGLVWLASYRPSWPWFSVWLVTLLVGLAVVAHPRVRTALNISWFGVTLLVLTATCMFDLYLFRVEIHRQRSERLEVHGVYFDTDHGPIRVGVGEPDLDVRLEGSLYDFDHWSIELTRADGNRFRVRNPHEVDMLRVRRGGSGRTVAALGTELSGRSPMLLPASQDSSELEFERDPRLDIELRREGKRGRLVWGEVSAALSLDDPLLDGRLSRRLGQGVPLGDLDWEQAVDLDGGLDRDIADDLVLTRTARGRTLGRLTLALPQYRIVSRSGIIPEVNGPEPMLEAGDTLWISSRGKSWAFAVDRVPGVSRVAAPIAVKFVRRPRRTGWALPSPEACGSTADRCAVISSKPLPPPQPHFDLSGFGLDTTRYSVLARLETDRNGVRAIGARTRADFAYGQVQPLPALSADGDESSTGLLIEVSRASEGRLGAVMLTVLMLYVMLLGALLVVSGEMRLWVRRQATSPHLTAAWGFLNVFLIFLGIRLALGLRIAYSAPFNDRGAATAVGLWITFAVMLIGLGRWSSWTPAFWSLVRRMERPVSRLFLPGVRGPSTAATAPPADQSSESAPGGPQPSAADRARGRRRTLYGLLLFLPSLGWLVWQRPEAAWSLLVAATALGAWLAMGIGTSAGHKRMGSSPMDVITADPVGGNASLSFAMAAGAAVVLVLAMHAPELALAPVLLFLALFGVDQLMSLSSRSASPTARAWTLYGAITALVAFAAFAFSPWTGPTVAVVGVVAGLGGLVLSRAPKPAGAQERARGTKAAGEDPAKGAAITVRDGVASAGTSGLLAAHAAFREAGRVVFSGVGWVGVLAVLGVLTFLNFQAVPPFVRFALVFMLFLLAIRAGLACRRVLDEGAQRGRFEALGLLVIPLGVLLVFMFFDFGLGLVFFAPMFVTVLLSARIDRLPGVLVLGSAGTVGLVLLVAWSVLSPSLTDLRAAPDVASFSEEYAEVGNVLTDLARRAGLSGPITRATVRSIAASDPEMLEEALAFAGPSEALFAAAPSREQVWGGRAYASAGWTGTGFAGTTLLGRGVPTAVSYAENTFAVYVLSEHGALGGLSVLAAYLALLIVVGIWIARVYGTIQDSREGLAVLAMTVGGVLWLTIPAVYVAASNLALVPLTGQNMPFLGLNSWADVVLVSGLASGIVLSLASLESAAPDREVAS